MDWRVSQDKRTCVLHHATAEWKGAAPRDGEPLTLTAGRGQVVLSGAADGVLTDGCAEKLLRVLQDGAVEVSAKAQAWDAKPGEMFVCVAAVLPESFSDEDVRLMHNPVPLMDDCAVQAQIRVPTDRLEEFTAALKALERSMFRAYPAMTDGGPFCGWLISQTVRGDVTSVVSQKVPSFRQFGDVFQDQVFSYYQQVEYLGYAVLEQVEYGFRTPDGRVARYRLPTGPNEPDPEDVEDGPIDRPVQPVGRSIGQDEEGNAYDHTGTDDPVAAAVAALLRRLRQDP